MQATEVFGPDTPLYNSRTILTYVKFIKEHHNHVDVGQVLSHAGMGEFQVQDENHWFTQEQVNRFHEKLIEYTGDKDIARKAGRYTASAECLGPVKSYAARLLSPARLCEIIGRGNTYFTKSCTLEAEVKGPEIIEVTARSKPGVKERPFQCENRKGVIEGALALFKHRLPTIEETECIFRGGECCRYIVKWRSSSSDPWGRARNWAIGPLAAVTGLLFFSLGHEVSLLFLALSSLALLALSAKAWNRERKELTSMLESQTSLAGELLEKNDASDNNARMTQEIGHVLTRQDSVPDVVREVARILEKRLDYDRGIILIADKEKGTLEPKSIFGYSEEDLEVLNNGVLSLEATDMLPVKCFHEQKAYLINNCDEIPTGPDGEVSLTRRLGIKAYVCCPMVCAQETIGVLAVGNKTMKRVLLQSDMDRLMLVAQELGATIQYLALKQTEKALRESGALFRAVVEKSSEVLLLTNVDGKILYVSPPVMELLGHRPEDLTGTQARGLTHQEDSPIVAEAMAWIRENPGRPRTITARARDKDNHWHWVEITMRNLLAEPGVGAVVSNMRDITDRKNAKEALGESETKFRNLVQKAIVGVYLAQDHVFRYVNAKCAEIHGYTNPEEMEGLAIRDTIFREDLPIVKKTNEWAHSEEQDHGPQQFRIVRKDGKVRHVETFGRFTTYQGKPAVIGMIVDITDRRASEETLLWKTTFLEALVDSSHDGILVLDRRMRKVMQNQRLVEMWKIPLAVAEAQDEERRIDFIANSIKNPEEFYKKLMHLHRHPDDVVRGELELRDHTVVEAFSYPVLGKDSREQYGRIWMFRDITEIRRYWDMLENLSATDGLTGISNRRRFDEFLEREWRRGMREYSELSLLFIDIDYFKEFNDRYGHLPGDDCLKQIAATLERTLRRAGDLVARYGGEEFACVLPGTGEGGALRAAHKILNDIARLGIPHEGSSVAEHVTVSIGVATEVPEKGREYSDLIKRADHSLYAAKQQGRNKVVALPNEPHQ